MAIAWRASVIMMSPQNPAAMRVFPRGPSPQRKPERDQEAAARRNSNPGAEVEMTGEQGFDRGRVMSVQRRLLSLSRRVAHPRAGQRESPVQAATAPDPGAIVRGMDAARTRPAVAMKRCAKPGRRAPSDSEISVLTAFGGSGRWCAGHSRRTWDRASCADQSDRCRPIVVQSGSPVEVELTPLAGRRAVGLLLTSNYYTVVTFQHALLVPNAKGGRERARPGEADGTRPRPAQQNLTGRQTPLERTVGLSSNPIDPQPVQPDQPVLDPRRSPATIVGRGTHRVDFQQPRTNTP